MTPGTGLTLKEEKNETSSIDWRIGVDARVGCRLRYPDYCASARQQFCGATC